MESCAAVEKEVDKVITKFSSINEHSQRVLSDVTTFIEQLRKSIAEGGFLISKLFDTYKFILGLNKKVNNKPYSFNICLQKAF